jgi:hypothetical protein
MATLGSVVSSHIHNARKQREMTAKQPRKQRDASAKSPRKEREMSGKNSLG